MEQQTQDGVQPQVNDQQEAVDPIVTAYCMKTKEKNVPVQDASISRTARGGYMVSGHDGKGNKMTAMVSKAKAEAAITAGTVTKAEGWVD